MKSVFYLNILIIILAFSSCADKLDEIPPIHNPDSIKVKLEFYSEKNTDNNLFFSFRIFNEGERDLARCKFVINNKYEHQLEGIIIKSGNTTTKLNRSLLNSGDSHLIVFNNEIDNYSIFGIDKNNFNKVETIELQCLDGKIIWKLNN